MKGRYFLNIRDMASETDLSVEILQKLVNINVFYVPQKKPVLLFFSKDIEKGKFIKKLLSMGYNLENIKKIVKEIGIPVPEQKNVHKENTYTIGEFCKKFQLNARQIKYWEDIGLFFPIARSKGGIRLYNEGLLIHIRFIQNLQILGFSLKEIKEIINNNDTDKIEKKINIINESIKDLRPIIKNMKKLK